MPHACQAVMFDLDGTLLDTLADIAAAGNHVLESFSLPLRPVADYRFLAGQGAAWLVETALGPAHARHVPEGVRLFRAYQMAHGLEQTRPYPGIPDLLDALTARGLKLAVLSNKPDAATQEAVRVRLNRWTFHAVVGHRDQGVLKPDPSEALAIARRLGVPPPRWLYLGDTKVDMETARAAGMHAAGALWGFRSQDELRAAGARTLLAQPLDLLRLLGA